MISRMVTSETLTTTSAVLMSKGYPGLRATYSEHVERPNRGSVADLDLAPAVFAAVATLRCA